MNIVQVVFKTGSAEIPRPRAFIPDTKMGMPQQRIQLLRERTAKRVTSREGLTAEVG